MGIMNGHSDYYFDLLNKVQEEKEMDHVSNNRLYKAQLLLLLTYLNEKKYKDAKDYIKELLNV